ncbi:MAG: hypothetical protein ACYC9W_09780 [Candidatus Limnocylindria bacterium]
MAESVAWPDPNPPSDRPDSPAAGRDDVWWYVDVYDVYEEWLAATKIAYTPGG